MKLRSDECVVVIVDMQEKLFPHMQDQENLLSSVKKLQEGARLLDVPVVVTQQYTKGLGASLPDLEVSNFIEKSCFSCTGEEEFVKALAKTGRKQVLVCGIESHICVLQTLLGLRDAGYAPYCVVDGVSSRKNSDKEVALVRMQQEGVKLTTVESALFELCGSAKHEQFKSISKLIK